MIQIHPRPSLLVNRMKQIVSKQLDQVTLISLRPRLIPTLKSGPTDRLGRPLTNRTYFHQTSEQTAGTAVFFKLFCDLIVVFERVF